jgi:hypothetical protein
MYILFRDHYELLGDYDGQIVFSDNPINQIPPTPWNQMGAEELEEQNSGYLVWKDGDDGRWTGGNEKMSYVLGAVRAQTWL